MNVKKFTGASSRDALRKVREALGPDAVILSNRQADGVVEILALANDDAASLASPPAASEMSQPRPQLQTQFATPQRPAAPAQRPAAPQNAPQSARPATPQPPRRNARPAPQVPSQPLRDQPKAPRPPRNARAPRSTAPEQPGLDLISRRPPKQKFANFEDYLAAHGGMTVPLPPEASDAADTPETATPAEAAE